MFGRLDWRLAYRPWEAYGKRQPRRPGCASRWTARRAAKRPGIGGGCPPNRARRDCRCVSPFTRPVFENLARDRASRRPALDACPLTQKSPPMLSTYEELLAVLRVRKHELKITFETLEAVSGACCGYMVEGACPDADPRAGPCLVHRLVANARPKGRVARGTPTRCKKFAPGSLRDGDRSAEMRMGNEVDARKKAEPLAKCRIWTYCMSL